MSRLRLVAAAIAISVAFAACGSDAAEVESASADEAAETSGLSGTFDTVSGSQIDLNSLEGQDTVLWFWAPW